MDDEPQRRKEAPGAEETGATAGKTHAQVLDEVVGRERRTRALGGADGPPPEDETRA